MYEKPERYRYDAGFLGYFLVFLCVAYVVVWTCYYCSAFFDVSSRSEENDDFLDVLLIWSSLKAGLALFVALFCLLSIYNPVLLLVLAIGCGVIWAGTLALDVKLIVDRYATCNSASDPHNLCNDLLYCCVYYDEVDSCAGLGPCENATEWSLGRNLTKSDLQVDGDFTRLAIFNGIFTFLEFALIVSAFGTLMTMKKTRESVIMTNRMLEEYHSGKENEEYVALLDNSETKSNGDRENENENENDGNDGEKNGDNGKRNDDDDDDDDKDDEKKAHQIEGAIVLDVSGFRPPRARPAAEKKTVLVHRSASTSRSVSAVPIGKVDIASQTRFRYQQQRRTQQRQQRRCPIRCEQGADRATVTSDSNATDPSCDCLDPNGFESFKRSAFYFVSPLFSNAKSAFRKFYLHSFYYVDTFLTYEMLHKLKSETDYVIKKAGKNALKMNIRRVRNQ